MEETNQNQIVPLIESNVTHDPQTGKFAKGNKLAKNTELGTSMAAFKRRLFKQIKKKDFDAVIKTVIDHAQNPKEGFMDRRLLFEYLIGKPTNEIKIEGLEPVKLAILNIVNEKKE